MSDELENKKIARSKANLEAAQNQHAEELKNKDISERKKFEQEKAKLKEAGLSDWLVLFKVVNQNLDFKKFVSMNDFKNCKDDINAVDEQGYTIAHLIAESKDEKFESENDHVFEFVISQPGFDFEKVSGEEDTSILHCACMNNRTEIAKIILVKYPELINKKTKKQETALHLAVVKGSFKLVKLLISLKINIDAQDEQGYTALMRAIYKDKNSIAKHLIQNGSGVNFKCYKGSVTALHLASAIDDPELIRLLLGAGANINDKNKFDETPVMSASSESVLDEFLKIKDLDVNACDQDGKTVLMHCVENKFIKLHQVRALLAKGADKKIRNKYATSAYEIAFRAKQPADMLELLGKIDNDTAIRRVSRSSVGKVASIIRDYSMPNEEYHKLISPSLNQKNPEEESFWNYCIVGNLDGIKNLLLRGNTIDFNLKNKYGQTGFSTACALGHTEIVRVLLKYFEDINKTVGINFDINSKNIDGITAFQLACKYNRYEIVGDLIGKINNVEDVLCLQNISPTIESFINESVENFKVKLIKENNFNNEETEKIIRDIEKWQKDITDKNKKLTESRDEEAMEVQNIKDQLFYNKEEPSDSEEEKNSIFELVDKQENDDSMDDFITKLANEFIDSDILNNSRNINITNNGKQES